MTTRALLAAGTGMHKKDQFIEYQLKNKQKKTIKTEITQNLDNITCSWNMLRTFRKKTFKEYQGQQVLSSCSSDSD